MAFFDNQFVHFRIYTTNLDSDLDLSSTPTEITVAANEASTYFPTVTKINECLWEHNTHQKFVKINEEI